MIYSKTQVQKASEILDKLIYITYLTAAVITPLIFTTKNTEIYEVPKMFFIYTAAAIVFFPTAVKFTIQHKITLPTDRATLAFAIFVVVQILSTFLSTDRYTSVFGYPTRLNGGLLSTVAYFVLFTGILININSERAKTIILAVVFTAVAVSLWGIPSHFGYDPSCFVLTGQLNSSCWLKDFDPQLRIFSTFGQPNWLASYLVLILPIPFILALITKTQKQIVFSITAIIIYWAIILTNSRAGLIGLAISLVVSSAVVGKKQIKSNIKPFLVMLIAFLVITFTFADFIAQRLPQTPNQNSPAPEETTNQTAPPTPQTLGTESGKIRLIVWQGALEVWKNWPVLGPGPETFVNTYYLYRPSSHNHTSEWEYFYNKTHNEFLNYLSSSGIAGLLSYTALLIAITLELLKSNKKDGLSHSMQKAALAGTFGYLATIFFGFSTVATQATFTLIIGSTLVLGGNIKFKEIELPYLKSGILSYFKILFLLILCSFTLTSTARLYMANVEEKKAETSSIPRSLLSLTNAITISPVSNPYQIADFAYETALYSKNIEDQKNREITVSESKTAARRALELAPNNYLITQKVAKAYVVLAENEDVKGDAKQVAEKLSQLAPNYAPAFLTKAQIYTMTGDEELAQEAINRALEFKPEYIEAQKLRDELTISP